jgi:hypothetical protein
MHAPLEKVPVRIFRMKSRAPQAFVTSAAERGNGF